MFKGSSIRTLLLTGAFVVVLTLGFREIHLTSGGYDDFPSRSILANEKTVRISIPTGAFGEEIGKLLADAGVVESTESFFRAAVANPKSGSIAPGVHELSLRISGHQAVEQLLDPKRITDLIRISEGAWNSEIFAEMASVRRWESDFRESVSKIQLPNEIDSLEGVLFPAQYSFGEEVTQVEALQNMVNKFVKVISQLDFRDPDGLLNKQQLVTLASLIQAEGDPKDYAKISRVIRNRLAIRMPLQLDSTVHFLKRTRGEIYLSTTSTELKSPYNTYQNIGLPPTPIGNPGLAALKGAIEPEAGDWIFFITVAPGDTRFTKSYAEFSSWKKLYRENRKSGAFE